jgi:hypothetical protein
MKETLLLPLKTTSGTVTLVLRQDYFLEKRRANQMQNSRLK